MEQEKVDYLSERLKDNIDFMESMKDDMDTVSWGSEIGVIITGNEAKYIQSLLLGK